MWIGIHRQSSAACLNPHAHTNRTQKKYNDQRTENNISRQTLYHTLSLSRRYDTHTVASRVRVKVRHSARVDVVLSRNNVASLH